MTLEVKTPLERIVEIARAYGLRVTDVSDRPRNPARSDHMPMSAHMPTGQFLPSPAHNPHRDHNTNAYAAGPPIDPGVTLADIEALLAHREGVGYRNGYRERDVAAKRERADVYDDAWRAGMLEAHRRASAMFADRIRAMHEALAIMQRLNAPASLPMVFSVAEAVEAELDALLRRHSGGPFVQHGARPFPEAPEAAPAERTAPEQEAADRDRLLQLLGWLREDAADGEIDEAVEGDEARLRYQRGNGDE